MKITPYFFLIIIASLFVNTASAQLSLAPTAVFINPDAKTGVFMITNTSDQERETTISLVFPQIAKDSTGIPIPGSTAPDSAFSIIPMTKVFPKAFVLKGQQSQIVRFIIMGKPGLAPGIYWARLVVTSKPASASVTEMKDGQIPTKMIFTVEQRTIIAYKNGVVDSDINFQYDSVTSDSANTYIKAKIVKSGNAPYWGRGVISIFDDKNQKVTTIDEPLAIFTDVSQRFKVGKKLPKGKYKAEVSIDNKREDIPLLYRTEEKEKKYTMEFDITN